MKHRIDPTVDCVFKALFATPQNKNLLVNFLNAVISPPSEQKIKTVDILNPYNEKEFSSDKLSIVDIKARDERGELYQVEIQLSTYGALRARMIYTLCDLYTSQLDEGQNYRKLKPVIAIWVISEILLQNSFAFHHHFQLYDQQHRLPLHDHLSLHVLELKKWREKQHFDPLDRWMKFLREGKNLDDTNLPFYMQTKEMRQAMDTLRQFSEKEKNYHQYQARINYLREQSCLKEERDKAILERDTLKRKNEELLLALKKAGIDPP
ncbi:Rpn family recombination-promoting nuclease/putative transposase [Magnetococcales bacterium HHB-1]